MVTLNNSLMLITRIHWIVGQMVIVINIDMVQATVKVVVQIMNQVQVAFIRVKLQEVTNQDKLQETTNQEQLQEDSNQDKLQ